MKKLTSIVLSVILALGCLAFGTNALAAGGSVTTYNGIQVTTLPYTVSGLTINNIEFSSGNKVTITVKNNTGYPISGLSSIEYKCYNGSGTVLKSGSCYLEDMKKGESCIATFYVESGTKKIIFGNAKIYK